MEQFQKKDANVTEKPRRSFWHRLKNFTFESPKKVVYEGNTVRLVPITPEVPKIAKPEKPVAAIPEPAAVKIEERKPVAAPPIPPAVKAKEEKPAAVPPKPAVVKVEKKEPVIVAPKPPVVTVEKEKPAVVAPEPVVKKKEAVVPPPTPPAVKAKEEKPAAVLPEPAVVKVEKKEPVIVVPKPPVVTVEKEKPAVVAPEPVVKKKEAVVPPPTPPAVEAKEEKPAAVPPKPAVVKVEKKEPVVVAPEPVIVEEIAEKKPVPVPAPEERLKKGLEKTRGRFWSRLKDFFSFTKKIDGSIIEELEDILIGADIGVKPVQKLIQEIHEAWEAKTITETSQINNFIKGRLKDGLASWKIDLQYASALPTVIMVVGVNGVGKTTSIAKLANLLRKDGKKVMVAASDTFRAAAVEQLEIWSKRIGVEIVKHKTGADPAAVAFDALEASLARGMDVLIVDTAGRLHTHENLMNELSKIKRVISKRIPGAPHEVLMVLDATTGQNSISQAKMFKQAVDVTGIFLAKLDGTAKGGIVLGMGSEINIPVKFIGLGETADDIERFNPDRFVDTLFEL